MVVVTIVSSANMTALEKIPAGMRRSRRNLIKMGAIAGSAANGGRSEIRSRFRSSISPWIDRRQKVDIIRDELEERGIAVLRDRNSSYDCRVFT
jgi:hypothetical protein